MATTIDQPRRKLLTLPRGGKWISAPVLRMIAGPVLTLVIAATIELLDAHLVDLPNPAALYMGSVVLSAYIGGIKPGLASAALAILFSALYLSMPGAPFHLTDENVTRLVLIGGVSPIVALLVGYLEERGRRARAFEEEARLGILRGTRELITLRAALDEVDHGILLLDRNMNSRFINRAFRQLFLLPDDRANANPSFTDLIAHGISIDVYDVVIDDLPAYMALRVAEVRDGTMQERDIRFRDGRVIRLTCRVLPGGGRMLVYANVTDLVQRASDLETLANTDGLTGLTNRREFMRLTTAELARRQRYDRPLVVLMLDIDHFKRVNDTHGHDVGDRTLVYVAERCRASLRTSDIIGRLGGEEFAVVLPETDATAGFAVAEKLRLAIAADTIPGGRDGPFGITTSIGLASARPGEDAAAILKRADAALYRAKETGRDRVVAAED